MEATYPLPSFYFTVAFAAPGVSNALQPDASFSEITGLEAKILTEDVREGGQNQFVHRLPIGTKQSNIVMKRGLLNQSSPLATWASATIGSTLSTPIIPKTLVIMLLGNDGNPQYSWNVSRAWPMRWDWGALHSTRNEIMVETLEFVHSGITRLPLT
jgi:phage tail-like protein